MNELKIKSLEELYQRLIPAFNVKISDLKRNGINNIKKEDIWDYLKNNNWRKKNNLSLAEMVDDIINISNSEVVNFVLSK